MESLVDGSVKQYQGVGTPVRQTLSDIRGQLKLQVIHVKTVHPDRREWYHVYVIYCEALSPLVPAKQLTGIHVEQLGAASVP